MFVLYAIPIGLIAGLLLGGRAGALGNVAFRWVPLAIGGFLIQAVLFYGPVTDRVGDAGPPIYVASTAAVLIAVLRNIRIGGLAVVALGAAANLAAIVANGGFMPAGAHALDAVGRLPQTAYSNSAVLAAPALEPLTDIHALPAWLPFSNVYSLGDLLIAVGIAMTIVIAMRPGARLQLPRSWRGTSTSD